MPRLAFKGATSLSTLGSSQSQFFGVNTLNSEPGNGATALHTAAEEGHVEVAKVLIEMGANVDSLAIGVTPLHLAVQYHKPFVVKGLWLALLCA